MHSSEFSKSVRSIVAKRAAYICANPACRSTTLHLADIDHGKVVFRGRVTHICALAENGARHDELMSGNQRKGANNAIFLCTKCVELVNRNKGFDYPATLLRAWKEQHKHWVREQLDRRVDAPVAQTPARKSVVTRPVRSVALKTEARRASQMR